MKCIGARYRDILRLNFIQLLVMVFAAGITGSLVGFLAQFGLTGLNLVSASQDHLALLFEGSRIGLDSGILG